jgi:amino acid transporter
MINFEAKGYAGFGPVSMYLSEMKNKLRKRKKTNYVIAMIFSCLFFLFPEHFA